MYGCAKVSHAKREGGFLKVLPYIAAGLVLIYAGAVVAYDSCLIGSANWCGPAKLERRLP